MSAKRASAAADGPAGAQAPGLDTRQATVLNPDGTLELAYRPPFDWAFYLAFHTARALPGVEQVDGRFYRRVVRAGTYLGVLEITDAPPRRALVCRLEPRDDTALGRLAPTLRRAFDLDLDPAPITAFLGGDPELAPLVAARPGLRVAGSVDPFEQTVRAILGQQISVSAARDLGGRLVARWGTSLSVPTADGLTHAFPTPGALAAAEVASLGMPGRRGAAVSALGAAVERDPGLLVGGVGLEAAIARLTALPGFGPWTAHYVAMRALREPDAFPASDIGLLRAWGAIVGARPSPAELAARAAAWSPWRAYAAQHLWALPIA